MEFKLVSVKPPRWAVKPAIKGVRSRAVKANNCGLGSEHLTAILTATRMELCGNCGQSETEGRSISNITLRYGHQRKSSTRTSNQLTGGSNPSGRTNSSLHSFVLQQKFFFPFKNLPVGLTLCSALLDSRTNS